MRSLRNVEIEVIYESESMKQEYSTLLHETFDQRDEIPTGHPWVNSMKIVQEHVLGCSVEELLNEPIKLKCLQLSPSRLHLLPMRVEKRTL